VNEISQDTYVNIMPQYYPCGLVDKIPGLNRRITEKEFRSAMEDARQAGIRRFDQRRKIFEVW